MRQLITLTSVVALTALSACGGETCADGSSPVDGECPCTDGSYPSDNDDGVCPTELECGVDEVIQDGECVYQCEDGTFADSQDDCPINLDPIAVGFEYEGAFDGTDIASFIIEEAGEVYEIPPVVYLTFANTEFFSATDEETQAFNSCTVFAEFDVIAGESVVSTNGGTVWNQWDTTMSVSTQSWDAEGGCAEVLDPSIWGEGGVDLLEPFTTFRYAFGFGPMTEYLEAAWQDDDGNWLSEDIEEFSTAFMAHYSAINDEDGNFVLEDWTTAYAFDYNAETGEIPTETDADGNEVYITLDMSVAGELPPTFIRTNAYWYQDFPLLDLSNLGDGRPVEGAE